MMIHRWMLGLFAISGLGLTSCTSSLEVFQCQRDSECELRGAEGECDPSGLCTYSDSACSSGRRFGDDSGDRSGVCTEPPDAGVRQSDANGSDADITGANEACQFNSTQSTPVSGLISVVGLEFDGTSLWTLAQLEPSGLVAYDILDPLGGVELNVSSDAPGGIAVSDGLLYVASDGIIESFTTEGAKVGSKNTGISNVKGLTILNDQAYILSAGDGFGPGVFKHDLLSGETTEISVADEAKVSALGSDGTDLLYTTKACSDCPVMLRKAKTDSSGLCMAELLTSEGSVSNIAGNGVEIYVTDPANDLLISFAQQ